MCLSCGGWPWNHHLHLAPEPVREEHIILDQNPGFYPDYRTGFHPPGPVYQTNQPSQSGMYYYPGNGTSPAGYYMNGYYYGQQAPTSTGWPYTSSSYSYYPFSTTPTTYPYLNQYSPYNTAPPMPMNIPNPWSATTSTAQAAAAVAANSMLSAMPNAPAYFVGVSAADIYAQNTIMAANMAAGHQMPNQLAPYKPGQSQQFWCKELDGSWTLREYNDVIMGELGHGHWDRHPTSGYYYYVRHTA